jgi:hypothetical protein
MFPIFFEKSSWFLFKEKCSKFFVRNLFFQNLFKKHSQFFFKKTNSYIKKKSFALRNCFVYLIWIPNMLDLVIQQSKIRIWLKTALYLSDFL